MRSRCPHHRSDGVPVLQLPAVQLHGDGQPGPDHQPGVPAAAARAVPGQRRPAQGRGAGPGHPRRLRRELLQERARRQRRAGVGPAAVERRRHAGRRAEVRRQRPGPVRAPVQLRVPQGHAEDGRRRGQDRRPGRGQEALLQDQLSSCS